MHLETLRRRWFGNQSGHGDKDKDNDDDDDAPEPECLRTMDEACETHRWDLLPRLRLEMIAKPTDYSLWRVPCQVFPSLYLRLWPILTVVFSMV